VKYFTRAYCAALLVVCVTVAALLAAVPPKTQTVQFKSGDETINGFLALPDSPGRHPGVIVIHEWWGLTDWAKQQTEKLAAAGYVALAVDLFRGVVTTDPERAAELSRTTPRDRAVRDLEAGFDFLAARSDVNKAKIGSIGWCMGGGYSFRLAVNEPRLAACVVDYGPPPTDPASIAKIKAPILGNFGADDTVVKPEAVKAFEAAATGAGKSVDIKIYDGAPHAFANENNKVGYRPEAAADAWSRSIRFFDKTLKK
jgi:carboxymethylenebutenolidase